MATAFPNLKSAVGTVHTAQKEVINIHVLFEGSCKNYPKPNPNLNPNPKPNSKIRKRKKENKKTTTKNEDVRDWNCKTPCFQLLLNDYLTNCVKSHSLLSSWVFSFHFMAQHVIAKKSTSSQARCRARTIKPWSGSLLYIVSQTKGFSVWLGI